MATLDKINNPVWGISTLGYGVIAEGLASIRQCIELILRTTKRSDPLRPEFGSEIFKYIDYPLGSGIPNIKMAILNALEIWEPRIKVINVTHKLKTISNPVFEITYSLVDEDLIDKILFDLKEGIKGSIQDTEVILQAFHPANPNNYPFQIDFEKNDAHVLPLPNIAGYPTLQEMFDWVQANWQVHGRWYKLEDRFVLYLNADGVSSASLSIYLLALIRVEAVFSSLEPGQHYSLSFSVSGSPAEPIQPESFLTPGLMLEWVQDNWGAYGNWYMEASRQEGEPFFSEEFNDEFEGGEDFTRYRLICLSNIEGFTAELNVSIEED